MSGQPTIMSSSHSTQPTHWKGNVLATTFIIITIGIAQFIAPPPYDWTQNTVSELAAQGYENKWLMQIGFIGFGVMLSITALSNLRWHIFAFLREIPLYLCAWHWPVGYLLHGTISRWGTLLIGRGTTPFQLCDTGRRRVFGHADRSYVY